MGLHRDLPHFSPPCLAMTSATYWLVCETVLAVGNYDMAVAEDRGLPNTPVQRFLKLAGACIFGCLDVGNSTDLAWFEYLCKRENYGLGWAFDGDFNGDFDDLWELYERWLESGETLTAAQLMGECV